MSTDRQPENAKRKWGIGLTILFLTALLMGAGPGLLLVNSPRPIFGLPAIYAWGLLWYGVQLLCVVLAFCFVWSDGDGIPE